MEDAYVAINHVSLVPSESKRSRRKKHESRAATTIPTRALNASTSDIPKSNATSSESIPMEDEVGLNNSHHSSGEASPTSSNKPTTAACASDPSPQSEEISPKSSSESTEHTKTSPKSASRAKKHTSTTAESEDSAADTSTPSTSTKSSDSIVHGPAPKLSKSAMNPTTKERTKTSSNHSSTPALLPSSGRHSPPPQQEQHQPEGEQIAFFAVFDGHAGARCSKFMMENFPKIFFDLKATRQGEIPVGLYKAFAKAEAQYCLVAKPGGWNDGSTGVVAVVHGHTLVLAHVGDSRAVLCRGKTAIELTHDHKPDRADETARITSLGGTVERMEGSGSIARVNGHLAVSRAFGDLRMKETQRFISSEPEITVMPLADEDRFVILASDGLWDVLTNQEAVDFVRRDSQKHKVAKNLVKRALKIGTTDNITAVVIWLTWVGRAPLIQSSSSNSLLAPTKTDPE